MHTIERCDITMCSTDIPVLSGYLSNSSFFRTVTLRWWRCLSETRLATAGPVGTRWHHATRGGAWRVGGATDATAEHVGGRPAPGGPRRSSGRRWRLVNTTLRSRRVWTRRGGASWPDSKNNNIRHTDLQVCSVSLLITWINQTFNFSKRMSIYSVKRRMEMHPTFYWLNNCLNLLFVFCHHILCSKWWGSLMW